MPRDSILIDPYNRIVTDVRIALTSSCNLHCLYCHQEGENCNGCTVHAGHTQLNKDDFTELVRLFADLGISTLKLTGGEPLLHPDILEMIRSIPSTIETSLTTNGTLLAKMAPALKEAGLSRVNISLDSLRPERYKKITGRNCLADVLQGIDAALDSGLTPVKINVVLLPGINDDEVPDFLAFVRGKQDLILQFIQLMDINGWADNMDTSVHENADFVTKLEQEISSHAKIVETRKMHHRRKYSLDGATIEIVRPMHNPEFCANCNRIRVTSDGKLKPCLIKTGNEVDIHDLHGDELRMAVFRAVQNRAPYFSEERR